MGVPSSFDIDVTDLPSITVSSVGPIGPVTIAGIPGIPNPFHIAIDNIPKIQLGVDKVQLGLDPLEVKPLSIALALKEMPSIRGHLPVTIPNVAQRGAGLDRFAQGDSQHANNH